MFLGEFSPLGDPKKRLVLIPYRIVLEKKSQSCHILMEKELKLPFLDNKFYYVTNR
jgi:hypothetical protein